MKNHTISTSHKLRIFYLHGYDFETPKSRKKIKHQNSR